MNKLGIIGAMEEEVARIKEAMTEVQITERASLTFYEGKLQGLPVVVVRSGIGKVNAAICTQQLIDLFGTDAIVNTGIAGSLDAAIDIGDILVIHDTGAHGHSMGYNYNGKLRSAEVLLCADGSHRLIRRAETPRDYFATLDCTGFQFED